jgi:hypothetical protein
LLKIIQLCKQKDIPVAYSCTRKELGLALYGRFMAQQAKASVVSVINITGFEEVGSSGVSPNC